MRTTITLTSDAEALVKRAMSESGRSFKDVVNDAIVDSLAASTGTRFKQRTFHAGPLASTVKALALAASLEDEAIIGKLERGA
jgi:hypothetical protein